MKAVQIDEYGPPGVLSVGTVLTLEDACLAHEMLARHPHARGKIVLRVATE